MRTRTEFIVTSFLTAGLLALVIVARAAAPPLGWTTHCRIVRVVDGDTVDVEVTKKLRVRLIDCWAPETTGDEKERGLDSAAHLRNRVLGSYGILHVPGDDDIRKLFTFGRVVGRVYVNDIDLSEFQVERGHATREKK